MQGLQRRVFFAMAMALTTTAASAQFAPADYIDPDSARARWLHDEMSELQPASPFLQPARIHVPGAEYVKLHFSEFVLPAGITVEVSNPDGTEVWRYSATARDPYTFDAERGDDGVHAFSAMSVTGDTALVRFTGITAMFDPGLHAVSFDAMQPLPEEDPVSKKSKASDNDQGLENTCGESQRVDAVCAAEDYPDLYERSAPVALIITSRGKKCTAWRVGSQNRLFTAEHCIGSQSSLDGAEIWFNYEHTVCGGEDRGQAVKVTGDEFLTSDFYLDFALFTVNDFSDIRGFGNLGLDPRDGTIGEGIFIPQHGMGHPKQISVESDMNGSGLCEIDDNAYDALIKAADIAYYCDTTTSSSGSPVISAVTGRAIALHHYGGCLNSGTKVAMIWPKVKQYFNGVVPDGDASGDWTPANEPPIARFEETCSGLSCSFASADSEDPDGQITQFLWDFDDGASTEGDVAEHVFSESGVYQVALTVIDDEGASDTSMHAVTVSEPNKDPVAKFSTLCVDNACTFDGSGSRDDDGNIVSWTWELGDGATENGSKVEHVYGEDGNFSVTLTVEDDDQASDNSSHVVSISIPNDRPVAGFNVSCSDLDCTVDAGSSTDPDGEIVSYSWDFGDGRNASGAIANHQYGKSGRYSITLTVTDDDGAVDSRSQTVDVEAGNIAPLADFSGSCTDNHCVFDAGASHDSDGRITAFEWSFADGGSATGETVDYTFQEEGSQRVVLTVSDDRGGKDVKSKYFDVTVPNDNPVANFSVSCEELRCTLDAGSSTDSEGSIAKYDWAFGDGSTATGSYAVHDYPDSGNYTVTLKVTDNSSASSVRTKVVKVEVSEKVDLAVKTQRKKDRSTVMLTWSGIRTASADIYREGKLLASGSNSGVYHDTSLKGQAQTVAYRVCEPSSGLCSDIVKVKLGKG